MGANRSVSDQSCCIRGDEQQVRCSLIQDDDREQGNLGAADDSPGGVLHGVVGFVGGAE